MEFPSSDFFDFRRKQRDLRDEMSKRIRLAFAVTVCKEKHALHEKNRFAETKRVAL